MGHRWAVRFDKWTYVLAAAAVGAAVVLGYWAGAEAGVLTALAGLVSAALWEAMKDRCKEIKTRADLLETADRVLVPRKIAHGGAARYLRPEEAVVRFWPRHELTVLREWLVSDRPAGIRLVTGEGGAGKTRLAIQLAGETENKYGWRSYWIPAGKEDQAVTSIRAGDKPALLIVDYAETRGNLMALLSDVADGWPKGPCVRVLLLARSAGEWWDQLIASAEARLRETLAATPVITLGPLTPPSGQAEAFQQALDAFAAELEMDCPPAELPPVGDDAVALVIHAAALLAALNHGLPETPNRPGSDQNDIIGGLLRHEAGYWRRSQARYGLDLGSAVTERAVAAGTLIGADDEASATRLLTAIDDLADPALRGKVARWLHDLYPTGTLGTAPSEWIGPLRPDLVAENLVVKAMTGQPQMLNALLAELPGNRTASALTMLARAALTNQAALGLIQTAIMSRPADLVLPAMAVAVETNRLVGEVVAGALEAGQWPEGLISHITKALPDKSVALAKTAALVHRRLVQGSANDEERAGNLVNWSFWLSELGRREEALAAVEEAVTIRRELAAARPDAFLPGLATALNNQSNRLSGLGRREEALAAVEEAVTIRRELAAARPDAFLPDLAGSLNSQSIHLSGLGRREEALAAIEEAVTIRRELAAARPDAFLPDLAGSLNNQSIHLSELGRREAAVAAIEEAVTAYRELAAARPDAFLPGLATALNNQSVFLSELGRLEAALAAVEEAVTAYRELAAARPAVFALRLASSLNGMARLLELMGRASDAEKVRAEAARL
jgi:tetratricopeptide (TPR) repeat protein